MIDMTMISAEFMLAHTCICTCIITSIDNYQDFCYFGGESVPSLSMVHPELDSLESLAVAVVPHHHFWILASRLTSLTLRFLFGKSFVTCSLVWRRLALDLARRLFAFYQGRIQEKRSRR
jgi:hypothetical protein